MWSDVNVINLQHTFTVSASVMSRWTEAAHVCCPADGLCFIFTVHIQESDSHRRANSSRASSFLFQTLFWGQFFYWFSSWVVIQDRRSATSERRFSLHQNFWMNFIWLFAIIWESPCFQIQFELILSRPSQIDISSIWESKIFLRNGPYFIMCKK